jgi:hypothetical protein
VGTAQKLETDRGNDRAHWLKPEAFSSVSLGKQKMIRVADKTQTYREIIDACSATKKNHRGGPYRYDKPVESKNKSSGVHRC